MTRVWLLLHLLGFVLWLGGGLAVMAAGIHARREERGHRGVVARAQAAIHKGVVSPGALLTVLSGLILTVRVDYGYAGAWLMVMQGAGLLAGLLTLFVGLPTVSRLARLDPAADAASFDELRARHALVASISGTLGLLALVAGAMVS